MESIVIKTLIIALFLAHWWMMIFAKGKLGTSQKDRSFDPLYSSASAMLAFASIFMLHCLGIARSFLLLDNQWPPLALSTQSWGAFLIRVLDQTTIRPNFAIITLAVLTFGLGFSLRLWAIRTLGRLFTFEIGIRPEHRIIEEGPYRTLRHPSYTGYLGMALGMGLISSSWLFLGLVLTGVVLFFVVRIYSEEKMLLQHFGPAYREYQSRTKKLIPYLF